MLIEVTQEDIDHGVRTSCHSCPVARAARRAALRATGRRIAVDVAPWDIRFGRDYFVERPLPNAAQQFIKLFDLRHAVRPFSFEIADFTPFELPLL